MDLEALYAECYRPLVGFLARRVDRVGRAEELAQEAFVRAIEHRPEQPRSWLFAVAANLARDELRRRGIRRRHLSLVRKQDIPTAPSPDAETEQRQRRASLHAALRMLSERDREALLLKEDGLSYDEIAERLQLAWGSVGTTLARARTRLAACYEQLQQPQEQAHATS